MWGHFHGPLGTTCGYEATHYWLDSCEGAPICEMITVVLVVGFGWGLGWYIASRLK